MTIIRAGIEACPYWADTEVCPYFNYVMSGITGTSR
jgi:hypothetical protein